MKEVWVYPSLEPSLKDAIIKVRRLKGEDYRTLIREIEFPIEAMAYNLKILKYKSDQNVYGVYEYWASFRRIHEKKQELILLTETENETRKNITAVSNSSKVSAGT